MGEVGERKGSLRDWSEPGEGSALRIHDLLRRSFQRFHQRPQIVEALLGPKDLLISGVDHVENF